MTPSRQLGSKDVIGLLATYREREPEDVGESIDSLELAWLVNQVESTYQVRLDLDDDQLGRMATVPGAVDVLRRELAGDSHG
jgi:acyl carrier protein